MGMQRVPQPSLPNGKRLKKLHDVKIPLCLIIAP